MCGRFTLTTPPERIAEQFDIESALALPPRYNIAPTQEIPVVRVGPTPKRHLDLLHWGLVPGWMKTPAEAARLINARSETVSEKRSFRAAFRARRCLIPADGFFEWGDIDGQRVPHHITLAEGDVFGMAGLWESWEGPGGTTLESCTILTTQANDLVAPLHDRMPVILDHADHDAWLDPDMPEPDSLRRLLRPYPTNAMCLRPVSQRVNNVRHDDALCLADPILQPSLPFS